VDTAKLELLLLATLGWQFTLVAVVGLVTVLFIMLFRMKATPQETVNIVRADPPIRKPGDPAFVSRRAKAAAAAMVLHHKRHSSGELDENR
jgi:hypothetical protein